MSDTTSDYDHREQLARIDNLREEALKFIAESRKLSFEELKYAAEQQKLFAEERKLFQEGLKLRRDRWLAPALALVSVFGAASGLLTVLHAIGVF